MTDDSWPFRHVALFCDHAEMGCETEIDADIRADSLEEALPGLRRYAREQGWSTADDGSVPDLCPAHAPSAALPAEPFPDALLGLPGTVDEETPRGGT